MEEEILGRMLMKLVCMKLQHKRKVVILYDMDSLATCSFTIGLVISYPRISRDRRITIHVYS